MIGQRDHRLAAIGIARLRAGDGRSRALGWRGAAICRAATSRMTPRPGTGVESDLHRHAHRDEHGELLEPAARGIVHTAIFDAYNGIERRYTPVFVHARRPARRLAPGGGHRRGVHRARRPVPVAQQAGARRQLCGFAGGARASDGARTAAPGRATSAASRGAPRSPRPCSPGARTMGSARAYPAFRGGTAVGQWRPTPPAFGAMSARDWRSRRCSSSPTTPSSSPGPPRGLTSDDVHRRFQRRQGARSQDRIDAHRRSDRARAVLGRQRQRPLESGGQPDRARQPPVHVRQQPAARAS